MQGSFTIGRDRFDSWTDTYGRLHLMHHERANENHSHSVGPAYTAREDMMAAARDHIGLVEDTGNCRGEVKVRMGVYTKAHIARLGTRRTRCGRDLPTLAEHLRVVVTNPDEVCGSCLHAY